MPPTDRFVPSFAAEPPQEPTPTGRWADTLSEQFLSAVREIDTEGEELGSTGTIRWFPDRTYGGRTYVPATAQTENGFELYGFVSYLASDDQEPSAFEARADFTSETAENNPDWRLDLSDDVIATWRGPGGKRADMTLVWGVSLIPGGALVTAELANLAVDQSEVVQERFTLLAPDNYLGDYLDVKLWGRRGNELAVESLYVDDD
ncbi:MAG: hypothetical protein J2O48_06865 [Solirubrobacterales bacterium]|nr:hypothetical protein [Solirubrobacterales bacterium]